MSARAGIVVTGTEVLSGRIADRNGPFVSDRLRDLGVDHAYTVVVGDRAEDMERALSFLASIGVDLIVTSGGLGPTADDLTAEVVARFQCREMVLDDALEERIAEILARFSARWPGIDPEAVRASNRKQAIVPVGATILEPVGTAPGLVVPPASGNGGPTVVVLPGPPRELQDMWPAAAAADAFAAAITGATVYRQHTLRLYGIPESEIAETLRAAEATPPGLEGLEITTCLRRGELEVVTRFEPAAEAAYAAFEAVVRERHGDTLFSTDGSTIDQQVATLLLDGGRTIATAESCTGGMLAGRLTDLAGSSAYVLGGLTVYSNAAKSDLAGVPAELIEAHGAVSPEVAVALADGARARFDADLGIGITGIAGPDGGSEEKPVGTVCLSVSERGGRRIDRTVHLPGGRADVRERTTTVTLHLLRRLLLDLSS